MKQSCEISEKSLINDTHNIAIRNHYNHNFRQIAYIDFIYKNIAHRMCERLSFIKINPQNILDIGSGLHIDYALLKNFYPKAKQILSLDHSIAMLQNFGNIESTRLMRILPNKIKKLITGTNKICADAEHLPLSYQSIDLAWSNLTIPYLHNVPSFFTEILRVLKLGGCFMLSGFGLDTFKELRALGLLVYDFPDMHNIGDMLLNCGFSSPVVDTEYITIEYSNLATLLSELRVAGAGSRSPGLKLMPHKLQNIIKTHNHKTSLTLEIFYVHAWKDKVSVKFDDNRTVINFFNRSSKN